MRFSKDPKLLGPENGPVKPPKKLSGVSQSQGTKISGPRKYVIFSVNFTGTRSATLIVQNKRPRPYIKSKREEKVRENDVIMKYEFYQDEIQWLKAVNRLISKHHRARSERNMNLVIMKLHEVKSISLL